VNTYTTERQSNPAVSEDVNGNFVVVWQSYRQDGNQAGIFGQRYDSGGNPVGAEFQVNTYTTDLQGYPVVASDVDGDFMVVWQSLTQDDGTRTYGLFGQAYDSDGNRLGEEIHVNTFTALNQSGPSVDYDSNGNFVVAWSSGGDEDGDEYGVFGRRFERDGTPLGGEFQVNTYTTGSQGDALVAADSSGNFLVVWDGVGSNGTGGFGRWYDGDGNPLGDEFQIHEPDDDGLAMDSSGNFVIVWRGDDGSADGEFGQRYERSGRAIGGEFQINTYTTGLQAAASVAMNKTGDFVVVWQSQGQDGHQFGVFGQRFIGRCRSTASLPTVLCPAANANGTDSLSISPPVRQGPRR